MATNFPTSLDTFVDPTGESPLNNPPHGQQHANANDAIEALQVKVGVNGSTDTSSLDYLVTNTVTLVDGLVPVDELPLVLVNLFLAANLSSDAPSNTLGLNGDYIIDLSNGAVWGPKASNVWPGSAGVTFVLA